MFNPPKLLGGNLTSRNYHGKIKLWEVTEKNCSFLMMAKPVHLRAKRKASTWLLDFEKGPGTSINLWMELILKFEVGESLGAATGEWLCGLHCSLAQHHCLTSSASAPSSTYMYFWTIHWWPLLALKVRSEYLGPMITIQPTKPL